MTEPIRRSYKALPFSDNWSDSPDEIRTKGVKFLRRAATIAGADGSRQPSVKELAQARFQGKDVASIVAKLPG